MKQANTAATYEKMVLSINEWMTEQGYEAFAEVVEVAPKRFELKLLIEADGSPRMPSVESIVDFLIGMSTGEVEKGGSRSARARQGMVREQPLGQVAGRDMHAAREERKVWLGCAQGHTVPAWAHRAASVGVAALAARAAAAGRHQGGQPNA